MKKISKNPLRKRERERVKEILIEEGIKKGGGEKIASCLFASTLILWWNDFPDARWRETKKRGKSEEFFLFKTQLEAKKIKRRVNRDL